MAATNYEVKMEDLNKMYYLVLNEYINIMAQYNTAPKLGNYASQYDTTLMQYKEMQSNFLLMQKEVEIGRKNLQKKMTATDKKIKIYKLENKKLGGTDDISDIMETRAGMLNDAQLLQQQQNVGNWLLFIILVMLEQHLITEIQEHLKE